MSEMQTQQELISAFLDEEMSPQQIDELLAQLDCEQGRGLVCRQAMLGTVLTGQAKVYRDISGAVRAAIREEPLPGAGNTVVSIFAAKAAVRSVAPRWKVPAAGLALAASMAVAAIVVVQPSSHRAESGALLAAQQEAPTASASLALQPAAAVAQVEVPASAPVKLAARELVIAPPEQARPIIAQWSSADAQPVNLDGAATMPVNVQERLNSYLINHARYGGGYALSGSLGYARVAASPQQRMDEPRK